MCQDSGRKLGHRDVWPMTLGGGPRGSKSCLKLMVFNAFDSFLRLESYPSTGQFVVVIDLFDSFLRLESYPSTGQFVVVIDLFDLFLRLKSYRFD